MLLTDSGCFQPDVSSWKAGPVLVYHLRTQNLRFVAPMPEQIEIITIHFSKVSGEPFFFGGPLGGFFFFFFFFRFRFAPRPPQMINGRPLKSRRSRSGSEWDPVLSAWQLCTSSSVSVGAILDYMEDGARIQLANLGQNLGHLAQIWVILTWF